MRERSLHLMSRQVEIPPERVAAWVAGFERRHGKIAAELGPGGQTLLLRAADDSWAELWQPWGPISQAALEDPVGAFAEHAVRTRRVGVIVVRRRRHAVAIVEGGEVTAAKLDQHYVQGRTAAGGWSQHRFERRRNNQARKAFEDAADDAAEFLAPEAGTLEALVTAGDRAGIAAVLADARCRPLAALAERVPHDRSYGIADPTRAVLAEFPGKFRAVRVVIEESDQGESRSSSQDSPDRR